MRNDGGKYRLESNWTAFKVERNRYRKMIRSVCTQVLSDKVSGCGQDMKNYIPLSMV